MIHVAIVEDDLDIQRTLALIIDGTPGFSCMYTYNDAESAIPGILDYKPDVVLMDVNLPGMSGIECVKKLKVERPEMDILMLTIRTDDDTIFDSLCAGATGYLLKHTPPVQLLKSVKEVFEGGAPMSMEIARKVLTSFRPSIYTPLSERETDILRKICEGHNYKTIAEELFISGHTVRTHLKNIYKKLHVNSRAEAVKKAYKNKLI
ncbi:MAG: response regulator transcription factor [Bacteroidota bacterium]